MVSSTFKYLTFSLILVSLTILVTNNLYFTINYTRRLQDEFRYVDIYLRSLRNAEWLSKDSIATRNQMGLMDMDWTRNKSPARTKSAVIPYLKRVKNPMWLDVVSREFKDETINIGLVNMDDAVMEGVEAKAKMVKVHFDPVREDIRWSDLYPERPNENSTCPDIPMPKFQDYQDLDMVVARIPYRTDVSRLQLNLVVANLLVHSGRKGQGPVLAVFVESHEPIWDIFRCNDLLWSRGNTWIYKPELARIKKLMAMPVGPCQVVPPPSNLSNIDQELQTRKTQPREAYVTILHSSESYVCGAIVLAQSIIRTNTTKDLILLADDSISAESIRALQAAGWKTHRIERIRSPFSRKDTYNEWNYSKLRIWQLKHYDKLMFIDADLIVIHNIDNFFIYPQLSATGNYQKHLFNSGLMLVEPSQCAYETLMEKMKEVESYNGGDQGFLNEMFTWWHRLPHEMNFMKVFVGEGVHLIEEGVHVVHYTGIKPWKCTKEEHDCNWDLPEFHRYASDSGHRMWWQVYRAMPEKLRRFCSRKTDGAKTSISSAIK